MLSELKLNLYRSDIPSIGEDLRELVRQLAQELYRERYGRRDNENYRDWLEANGPGR